MSVQIDAEVTAQSYDQARSRAYRVEIGRLSDRNLTHPSGAMR